MDAPERSMRDQILVKATGLFIQRGYHGLAMREISDALGVTKAALYYHFQDKEELFLAILKNHLDEMEILLDRILAEPGSSRERIRHFVERVLAQPTGQRAIIRLASQEMGQLSEPARKSFGKVYQQKFIAKVEAVLRAGMEAGEFKSIRPEVATWTLLGMMYPYFYPAHAGDTGLPADAIREIVTVYLDGIAAR